MHKAMLLFLACFLIFTGCNERDMEMSKSQQEPGSLERLSGERALTDESGIEEISLDGVDEKIMKTAFATVKTSDVMESYDKALNLIKKYDGIILNAGISRYDGSDEAQVLIKIEPQYFMVLLEELGTIGTVESKSITEEDVTEAYYDINARLANARKVQDRLYGILNRANKVEDILKVEKEIERIGEKIEVLEGKIRYFDSKVDYSRITITIYSKKRPFINLGSVGRGFGNAVKYAVYVFFLVIWFIIIIIPLAGLVFVLKPAAVFIIRRIKRKK